MSTLLMLRVKTPGPVALDLLGQIEAALHVGAQPQTAGFVPIALEGKDPKRAREAVIKILDDSGVDWRKHLEFRS